MIMFPVGHYMGPFHPGVDQPRQHQTLRIGKLAITMGDDPFAVWAAAHRPPDRMELWTRDLVAAVAAELGVSDPVKIIDEFLEDGILVEVDPRTDDATGFARYHRLMPLMVGLGNTPEDPLNYGIGLLGVEPAVKVPTVLYDVWQWSSVGSSSLWEVCEAYAESGVEANVSNVQEHDPAWILGTVLEQLQVLLGINAVCLDEFRPPTA